MDTIYYDLLDAQTGEPICEGISALATIPLNVSVGTVFSVEDDGQSRAFRVKEVIVPLRKPVPSACYSQLDATQIYVEPYIIPYRR